MKERKCEAKDMLDIIEYNKRFFKRFVLSLKTDKIVYRIDGALTYFIYIQMETQAI